ncbi:MAG: beta-ketoacyl-ACP reductase [Alphaproteobacteria bacterium]|nr:beta-ketoacyl-ACP reductase [Alphaproteobacteria bacterium]HCQ70812.1 beta-ketoacyl-ACP reductase [Rhodospirillaceae bacterium]|tara:strand:+ start:17142 stop:17870 length:729 start_codon:yes stop_codon:yes gene_type:complete
MTEKKLAIVTGGTRGIGLDISKALIAEGYQVAALYAGNDAAAKAFKDETGHAAYKVDVTDLDACIATVEKAIKKFGAPAVLVNNAGITRDGMLHKMGADQWSDVITTNLSSCFNMCRAVMTAMRDAGFGRIINISSINGQKGQLGQTNYAAAKAGMLGFTKSLALESARKGITVNAICPGYIKTDMTASMDAAVLDSIVKQIPQGRMGAPSEIAAIVAFLASEKAAFITGATISANGGQYMI